MYDLYLKLILEDLRGVYRDLSYFDLLRPIGALIWLILISRDISVTDRRDRVSGLGYGLYMAAAATVLFCVLPEYFVDPLSLTANSFVTALAFVVGVGRWNYGVITHNYSKKQTSLAVLRPTGTDPNLRAERVRSSNSSSSAA